MPLKPSFLAIKYVSWLAFLADQQGDAPASNIAWALKAHMLYGRPSIRAKLARLSFGELRALVQAHRGFGADVGAAWWAVRRWVESQNGSPAGQRGQWTYQP